MAERKFGWAEALAAALSGIAGTDYTGLLAEQIEEEKRRKEREAERDYQRGRDYRADFNRVVDDLTAELTQLGEPTSPVTASPSPFGVAVNPDFTPGFMGESDDLLKYAEVLLPGHGQEVLDAARPRAGRSLRGERAEYERERAREVAEIPEDAALRGEAERDNKVLDWDDPEMARIRRENEAEDLRHTENVLRLQNKYSPSTGGVAAYGRVVGRLEDTAYNEAFQLRNGADGARLMANPMNAYNIILDGLRAQVRAEGLNVSEADLANMASKAANSYFPKLHTGVNSPSSSFNNWVAKETATNPALMRILANQPDK